MLNTLPLPHLPRTHSIFDPKNIVELAIEAGCNCVASTYGVLASVSRRYAHKIPFLVKLNHNETLSYPTQYDQTLYASVEQAFEMGAVAVGATIYFWFSRKPPPNRRDLDGILNVLMN